MSCDYRPLNLITFSNRFFAPNLDECIDYIQDAKYFCALDIKGFLHNLEIEEGSKHLTGFIMLDSCYCFEASTFGFKNTLAYFQHLIKIVLCKGDGQVVIYLDNIYDYSN